MTNNYAENWKTKEEFEDAKGVTRIRKSEKLSNTNPTKFQGWTQGE